MKRVRLKGAKNAPLVGNMGLYAVCYELSKRGWNVMPTSRNAKGIDIVGYDQRGEEMITVQVKALSKKTPVALGSDPELCNLLAKYVVVARGVRKEPEFFIARTDDIRPLVHTGYNEAGKRSCWLQRHAYEGFKDQWDTIGEGW
ncbi:MAG: hypothetical protein JWN40_5040 [Phycisphaerales bacterium]|nr:hypothetical protein [Phycisphaerales bacterium]